MVNEADVDVGEKMEPEDMVVDHAGRKEDISDVDEHQMDEDTVDEEEHDVEMVIQEEDPCQNGFQAPPDTYVMRSRKYFEFRRDFMMDCLWAGSQAHPPPVPKFISCFVGLEEINIHSSPLVALPPEFGRMSTLKRLAIISCRLEVIPKEIGALQKLEVVFLNGNHLKTLPDEFGRLRGITELCLDANNLIDVPTFEMPNVRSIGISGNQLTKPLRGLEKCTRLEELNAHGNDFEEWEHVPETVTQIRLMGSQLKTLFPSQDIGLIGKIMILHLCDNYLVALPSLDLPVLEWLLVYNNNLTHLPEGLEKSTKMQRLLIEANPIIKPEMDRLANGLHSAVWPQLRTVGLDDKQGELLDGWAREMKCFKIAPLLNPGSRKYMKLIRGNKEATSIIIAFSASHGEVEWAQILGEIDKEWDSVYNDWITKWFPREAEISWDDFVYSEDMKDKELMSGLWTAPHVQTKMPRREWDRPFNFDVLLLCDTRMRWYLEDRDQLERDIEHITKPYERVMMVGSSMGGFGALLYAHLADKVVAFSPQVSIHDAHLRSSGSLQDFQQWQSEFDSKLSKARERGTDIEVHCGADEHVRHAILLAGKANITTVLHPVCPRRPLTRVLKEGNILWGIVSAFISEPARRLNVSKFYIGRYQSGENNHAPHLVLLPCTKRSWSWTLLKNPPRPGDWYCGPCGTKIFKGTWYCQYCGKDSLITDKANRVVFGSPSNIRRGDWACGGCEKVNWQRAETCVACKEPKDHPETRHFGVIKKRPEPEPSELPESNIEEPSKETGSEAKPKIDYCKPLDEQQLTVDAVEVVEG